MAEEKKFYWLKLKRNFFKRHDIRIIEEMENGKDYILFYLKMLLESIDHEGELRFSETIPYNEKMLSVITNTNIDIVRSAMKVFIDLNMIEILDDNTIYMAEVLKLTGSETAGAERVRKHRDKKRLLQCNADETKCNTEKEIEKEKDLEKDNKPYKVIIDYLNEQIGTHYRPNNKTTQKHINARLSDGYTVDDFKTVIDKMCAKWKGTDMEQYLRPETLFGTKFESYLNAKINKRIKSRLLYNFFNAYIAYCGRTQGNYTATNQ
jgi:uncharacterized phage protein (TIGR02220 family)/predicted phage replisome organizer